MPFDVDGVFTRVSNSFSNPSSNTTIDPSDATELFDDYDDAFNNSTPFTQPNSMSTGITQGHVVPYCDSDAQFGNEWSQYPFGAVSANPVLNGKAGSSIGSATPGQTFKIVFTSAGLTGSPITKTYTAVSGDTVTTVAQGLAAVVNADPILHGVGGKPIFMQAFSGGAFNLQYDDAFGATGATPLTTATTGSTGTITLASEVNVLDFIIMQLGRAVPSHAGKAGDGIWAIDFTGQSTGGTLDTHYAQLAVAVDVPTSGSQRGAMYFNTANGASAQGRMKLVTGLQLFDSVGANPTGTDKGAGTINVPSTGGYYVGGNLVGEYQESVVTSGSAVSLVSGTGKTVTSVSLTAGEWDVSGAVSYITAASTSVTGLGVSISATNNTQDNTPGRLASHSFGAIVTGAGTPAFAIPIPDYRLVLGSTTTIYLVTTAFFSVSTLSAYGILRARRIK